MRKSEYSLVFSLSPVRINEENLHTESGRERRAEIEENRFHLFLGSREEK